MRSGTSVGEPEVPVGTGLETERVVTRTQAAVLGKLGDGRRRLRRDRGGSQHA